MLSSNCGFGTKVIHAGNLEKEAFGSLATPIYQSSTFYFDACEQGGKVFVGEEPGYAYTRLGNPTTTVLQDKVAALEGAEAALATSSGMGAIAASLWTIARAGAHIVADKTLYGCTFSLLSHGMTRYGVETTFVDTSHIDQLEAALRPNTVAVYLETPANPTLKICDLALAAKVAHQYNPEIMVLCDNTFASPYLQRPLELGCDVSLHSATKYLNGHGDVIAGFAVGKKEFISQVNGFGFKDLTGCVLSPNDSFLILRGLKTLELRMERHCDNADVIARFLDDHPKIQKVYFPGLESHPQHEIAKKQMHRFGAMMAFEIEGGKAAGMKFVNSLRLCRIAVSLGDAETLVQHPASMTHSTYSPEELTASGISQGLVRLSCGLENVGDILSDFEQALRNV